MTIFPKYKLNNEAIKEIATVITGETGGNDVVACLQEASQMANLNEITYKRENIESAILKTLKGGWYAKASWTRGCTDLAIKCTKQVFIEGKRCLPRYVTEHDTFPLDIKNAKSRNQYKFGDPVNNVYGSNYYFYTFFGNKQTGDIAGYFQKDYVNYKDDEPWPPELNDVDVDELNKLISQCNELSKYINEQENKMIYNYLDSNIPDWAYDALKWELDNDILKGTDTGLNLTNDDLRQIVREYRFFKLIQDELNK